MSKTGNPLHDPCNIINNIITQFFCLLILSFYCILPSCHCCSYYKECFTKWHQISIFSFICLNFLKFMNHSISLWIVRYPPHSWCRLVTLSRNCNKARSVLRDKLTTESHEITPKAEQTTKNDCCHLDWSLIHHYVDLVRYSKVRGSTSGLLVLPSQFPLQPPQ